MYQNPIYIFVFLDIAQFANSREKMLMSIKHVSLTAISSTEYIYVHIKYIRSKSNTQNCQV